MPVFHIPEETISFPHPSYANPEGLLGIGGDLRPDRLIEAYQNGIFPWYSSDERIMWWCLTPRLVLFPDKIKISKSMRSYLNLERFRISFDQCFEEVVRSCKDVQRSKQQGSWIHDEIMEAYGVLFDKGVAHSVEVWQDEHLVGGLYGVAVGKMFCGESMFTKVSNASKYGFIKLAQFLKAKDFLLIDCQQETMHLKSLGAELMTDQNFFNFLEANKSNPIRYERW
ncbi:MAG: leucyl/phenylalanyl-tRNA--protein transferase [Bacteroidota bacterium]|nr:leucyl/phenylalanyl-tRNA--protein transferase [Bacteroidota bacterium]